MFIYTHFLSEIILDSEGTENAMKELIQFYRQEYEGNEEESARIEEFENNYQKTRAIWWFNSTIFSFQIKHVSHSYWNKSISIESFSFF